jgi:hypothetical protein
MTTFAQADSDYRLAIEAPGRELAAAFAAARSVGVPDLSKDELTEAVLLRLKSFLVTQDAIKTGLNKVYAAPAADFLVETVAFYLQVALENLAKNLLVASERNAVRHAGSLRPDISIWRGEELVAAVECKTQLGWNRDGWLTDFEDRESRLREECPQAKLFLLVMTASNWSGFGDDQRVGKQFFVLLHDTWPRDLSEYSSAYIVHRVEQLVAELLAHTEA